MKLKINPGTNTQSNTPLNTQSQSTTCPNCSSKNIRKFGKKKAKLKVSQRYQCKDCKKIFTLQPQPGKNKTYPINIILNAISYYNLGYSQIETAKFLSKKFKVKPSQKTISNWIDEYRSMLPFNKLRQKAKKLYSPETIIENYEFLHNNLPYTFQIHQAKLELLFKDKLYNNQFINQSKFYEPIKSYLEKITTEKFPHHIFKQKQSSDVDIAKLNKGSNKESRASQLKFPHLEITHLSKTNLANRLASLGLMLAKSNKDRHQAIQNFFLINDSTTIATEIPVYLTGDDIRYFQKRGFTLDFEKNTEGSDADVAQINNSINKNNLQSSKAEIAKLKENKPTVKTPITGHIDILQIRNGLIHILDYKSEANKQNPTQQLTIYALALASRTKLDLHSFKCAWFDENNYFEFFPLHAIYKKRHEKIS